MPQIPEDFLKFEVNLAIMLIFSHRLMIAKISLLWASHTSICNNSPQFTQTFLHSPAYSSKGIEKKTTPAYCNLIIAAIL